MNHFEIPNAYARRESDRAFIFHLFFPKKAKQMANYHWFIQLQRIEKPKLFSLSEEKKWINKTKNSPQMLTKPLASSGYYFEYKQLKGKKIGSPFLMDINFVCLIFLRFNLQSSKF